MCALVLEVFTDGHGIAEFCLIAEINKCTFHEWKHFEDFSAAYEMAKIRGLAWWERELKEGLCNRNFNVQAWSRQVINRFRKEYADGNYVHLKELYAGNIEDGEPALSELDAIKKGLSLGQITTDDALKISQVLLNLAKTFEMSEMATKLLEIEAKLDEFKDKNSGDSSLSV